MPGRRPFCCKGHASHGLRSAGRGSGFALAAPFLGRLAGDKGPPTDTHYARATAFSCYFEIEPGTESIPSAEFRNGKSVLFVSHMHLHTPKSCLDCAGLAEEFIELLGYLSPSFHPTLVRT